MQFGCNKCIFVFASNHIVIMNRNTIKSTLTLKVKSPTKENAKHNNGDFKLTSVKHIIDKPLFILKKNIYFFNKTYCLIYSVIAFT